jgi:hypothetical protein
MSGERMRRLSISRSTAKLCGLHLLGDALILWLGYMWLGWGESDAMHLIGSVLIIVLFACAAVWLHGTAFAQFGAGVDISLRRASVSALRHVPPLLVLAILACLLYGLLNWLYWNLGHAAFVIGSYFTLHFRKPIPPATVLAVFHAMIWVLRWIVLPVLLVPVAARIAIEGWRGFRFSQLTKRWLYWVQVGALLVGAIWLPMKLLAWVPTMPNFTAEMASFLVRFAMAYLLFAGMLLVLEWRTAGGTPFVTQRSSSSIP